MKLSDFDFQLPDELIAQYPLPIRSASRLLCLNKINGQCNHTQFNQLTELLNPGDLLIFNDTKVIPARLFGSKVTGGRVELLVERIIATNKVLAQIKASKSPKIGTKIILEDSRSVEVIARYDDLFELLFPSDKTVNEVLDKLGHIPIPPYLKREDEKLDQERYQTVYAKQPGAVAAPTAGLHFDEKILERIREKGVQLAYVTLHVGAATFQPVRVNQIVDHQMHSEFFEVNHDVIEKIHATKANNKKVIAVGTTTVRALETLAKQDSLQPYKGETSIFIYPGFQFKWVDALVTNFHLPQSTLLMLVCAFAGYKSTMSAYAEAVTNKYRFFSYGDAMWVG